MKKVILKETQGQRKLKQYLEDLGRNKHFVAKLKKLKKELELSLGEKMSQEQKALIDDAMVKQEALDEAVKKLLKFEEKGGRGRIKRIEHQIADEYALDFELGIFFIVALLERKDIELGWIGDFCAVHDNYDEHFNDVFPSRPFEFDTEKQLHIKAFPVSIGLHRFATKRDVLDYIEKRWEIIEDYLELYRGDKKRFRQRKFDRKLTDFIWENRNLPWNDIKTELDKKFLNNGLAYFEIGKMISIERRRRLRKLA